MKHYVLGFRFSRNQEYVTLIRKKTPTWQAGLLNGVGGKIEGNETPKEAMIREFHEEAGVIIPEWEPLIKITGPDYVLNCFTCSVVAVTKTMTAERVTNFSIYHIPWNETVPHLKWLIPYALDPNRKEYTLA